MADLDLAMALRIARSADPSAVAEIVAGLAESIGASDVVVYLVDFAQVALVPLPDRATHAAVPVTEEVAATMAGRAFLDERPVVAERPNGARVWVPIIEGSSPTGVLAVTVGHASATMIEACETLGLFAGDLIAVHARSTDVYSMHRRRRPLSLSATMQWDLLPPLVLRTNNIALAGLIEPAYNVGGDCFDYAANGAFLDVGIFDPVGHDLGSAQLAALAVGSYRHERREGSALAEMHASLDDTIAQRYQDSSFVTGQLARIELTTGLMRWTNAGHPPPMLIRHGHVVRQLACPPTPPWGLGVHVAQGRADVGQPRVDVSSEQLEPGDSILFFSDGSIEAHAPSGEPFGTQRLADLASRHASDGLEAEQIVRHLTRSVLEHHQDTLTDDATFVLVRWIGP